MPRTSSGFWRDLTQRVEAIPGVVHAGASGTLPLANAGGCSGVIVDVVEPGRERGNCMPMTMVTPGYFEAMGIKVRGTLPTWSSVEAGTAPSDRDVRVRQAILGRRRGHRSSHDVLQRRKPLLQHRRCRRRHSSARSSRSADPRSVFPDRRPAGTRRSGSHSATCASWFALRR